MQTQGINMSIYTQLLDIVAQKGGLLMDIVTYGVVAFGACRLFKEPLARATVQYCFKSVIRFRGHVIEHNRIYKEENSISNTKNDRPTAWVNITFSAIFCAVFALIFSLFAINSIDAAWNSTTPMWKIAGAMVVAACYSFAFDYFRKDAHIIARTYGINVRLKKYRC